MPRRSPYSYYKETPEEQRVRVLKEVRQLTNLLKSKIPEMLTWEVLDEDDLRRMADDLTGLKSVLPKRERQHGEWEDVYKVRTLLNLRASLVGWLAREDRMNEFIPVNDQRKLNAAVETALDALQARQKDDEALSLIDKMNNNRGRTEEEKPQFIAKAKEIEERRRWRGGAGGGQSYWDYLMGKHEEKSARA